MRAPRALLVVLTACLVWGATVVLAPPSSAGGPTSVMLVNSPTGRAAALHYTDARYERLSRLIGGLNVTPTGSDELSATERERLENSGGINLTWLAHDVQPFRVDRVYLDAPGGPVIATQIDVSGGSLWDVKPVWRRPADAKGLIALLNALGLTSTGSPAVAASSPATAPAPVPAAPQQQQSTRPAAADAASTTRGVIAAPLWGLAGALVGAALVLGLGRMRRTDRSDSGDAMATDAGAATAEVIPSNSNDSTAGTPMPR
jgi:hypothetical protein